MNILERTLELIGLMILFIIKLILGFCIMLIILAWIVPIQLIDKLFELDKNKKYKCKNCGKKMIPQGYIDEFGLQKYRCPECKI